MAKKQQKQISFEETLKALESIVNHLENGDLTLDEALNEFEQGVRLAREGQLQLQKAEQRIQILLSESAEAELSDFTLDKNE